MSHGPFQSCDNGYMELLGKKNWETDNIAVLLVRDGITAPVRTAMTYADVSASTERAVAIVNPSLVIVAPKFQFRHERVVFTLNESLTGRYVFYVLGNHASLQSTDMVIGHVDLTGSGNASSVNAEFSFIPYGTGFLFEINRTVASS